MRKNPNCYSCGQPGHIARFCHRIYHQDNRNSSQLIQCFRCQGFGHRMQNCTDGINHYFRYNDPKNSKGDRQSSSRSTKTNSHPLNYSSITTTPKRELYTRYLSQTIKLNTPFLGDARDNTTLRSNNVRAKFNGRNRTTKLETLPNELLLNLFGYLSAGHLLNAFHRLNSHFESLIFTHLQACHLDFRRISKGDSKMICRRYLPLIRNRIISLRLSDDNLNAKQTNLLTSKDLVLHQFHHLRSLSLCYIRSEKVMDILMIELSNLTHLTHLKLIKCHKSFQNKNNIYLSNSIWSLPKLTHFYVDTEGYVFYTPTKLSLSIELVSISGHCCRINEVDRLLKKTPRLRSLSIRHRDLNDEQYFSSFVPSITTLKLYDIHSRLVIKNLLKTMINLTHLTVETFYIPLDGHHWERIISNHLPKLRVFRLKMDIQFAEEKNNEEHITELFDSFRSRFWLEERQWFVRCHWKPQTNYSDVLLYTIPLVFRDVNKSMMRSPYKSTCPTNKNRAGSAKYHL